MCGAGYATQSGVRHKAAGSGYAWRLWQRGGVTARARVGKTLAEEPLLRWNGGGSSGGWACVCAAQPGVSCGVCQKCRACALMPPSAAGEWRMGGAAEVVRVHAWDRWGGREVLCPLPATARRKLRREGL